MCALIATLLLFASPLAARLEPGAWLPLLAYVTPRGGSLFPLLPWGAHMLFGAAFARVLLCRRRARAAADVRGSLLIAREPVPCRRALRRARHLSRLGFVLGRSRCSPRSSTRRAKLPAWAWVLSGETLFIYAFHVLLVYGAGRRARGGRSAGGSRPLPSVLLAAGVIALSFGGALVYRRFAAGLARSTATG